MGKAVEILQASTAPLKRGTVQVEDEGKVIENFKDGKLRNVIMCYFREPMSGNNIYHDFLVITANVGDLDSELGDLKLYIRSEKTFVTGGVAKREAGKPCKEQEECVVGKGKVSRQFCEACASGQILITVTQNRLKTGLWQLLLEPVKFNDCGNITLNELLDVLRDHSKRYFLLKHNCWRYASKTFAKVIKKYMDHEETDGIARDKLTNILAQAVAKFPKLPSDYWKKAVLKFAGLTIVAGLFMTTGVFLFHHPADLTIGKCLTRAIDGLLLLSAPIGLRTPILCAKGPSAKLVYNVFKKLRQSRLGRTIFMNPSLLGKLVRILSSQGLPLVAISAITFAVLAVSGYLSYEFYKIYRDNHTPSGNDGRRFESTVDVDTVTCTV